MAKILKLKIPTLELVDASNIVYDVPNVFHLTKHIIFNSTTIDQLKAKYVNYDIFQHMSGKIDSPIHYHDDTEIRVFIRGNPVFYIVVDEHLYVIECSPLDQIELAPNVIHWFTADSEILAFRFFSKNAGHIMHTVDNLSLEVVQTKRLIDTHGLKISYE